MKNIIYLAVLTFFNCPAKFRMFFLLIFFSLKSFSQKKVSLRKLLLSSDIVALVKEKSDFIPKKEVYISDYKKMHVLDSIEVVSYIKGRNKIPEQLFIEDKDNSFFYSHLLEPVQILEEPGCGEPLSKSTLLFLKKHEDYTEALYFLVVENYKIQSIKNFAIWLEATDAIRDNKKKSEEYINKYISNLSTNHIYPHFTFFEKILSPNSIFSSYYNLNINELNFTDEQKIRLKKHLFNNPFDDIELTKLVFKFYNKEVLNYYKKKIAKLNLDDYTVYEHEVFFKFMLKKNKQWNTDTNLLLRTLSSYNNDDEYLKEDILNEIKSKICDLKN